MGGGTTRTLDTVLSFQQILFFYTILNVGIVIKTHINKHPKRKRTVLVVFAELISRVSAIFKGAIVNQPFNIVCFIFDGLLLNRNLNTRSPALLLSFLYRLMKILNNRKHR